LAYLVGILAILSLCIRAILPFTFARADQPANVSFANRPRHCSPGDRETCALPFSRQPSSDQIEIHIIRLKSDELYVYFRQLLPLVE
jgi:hypothetical protein